MGGDDDLDRLEVAAVDLGLTPEQAFDRQWAQSMVDRGGRISVSGPEEVEFLLGAADKAEPAAERRRYESSHELAPATLELIDAIYQSSREGRRIECRIGP